MGRAAEKERRQKKRRRGGALKFVKRIVKGSTDCFSFGYRAEDCICMYMYVSDNTTYVDTVILRATFLYIIPLSCEISVAVSTSLYCSCLASYVVPMSGVYLQVHW